jgi:hypothetical protein
MFIMLSFKKRQLSTFRFTMNFMHFLLYFFYCHFPKNVQDRINRDLGKQMLLYRVKESNF